MVTAIYERASDEKQDIEGVSIETQHDTIMKFCEYKGYENIKLYTEIRSARSMKNRDQLKQLLEDVKNGRVKRIIIYKLDRLTRSLRDLMNILHKLDQHNCELHSTYESIDTSSPSGRMLVQVLGMIAEWESANTSMRVRNAMQYKAEQGIWQSSVPFGFDLSEDKRLVINDHEANILQEAFQLVFEGSSFSAAEETISNKYGLSWANDYLAKKARFATTIGNMERNGKVIKNTHDGIITEGEQQKLIEILEKNAPRSRGINHLDIFRRKIACQDCDSIMSMSANSYNNYKTTHYSYVCEVCYKAKRPFVSVAESVLLKAFEIYMSRLKIADFDNIDNQDKSTREIASLKNRLKALERQRDRIQRAWIQERMTDDDLDQYQKEIESEQMEIEEQLSKLSVKRVTISNEEVNEIKEYFTTHFNELTREEKRSFVQQHIRQIHYKRTLVEGFQKKYNTVITNIDFF